MRLPGLEVCSRIASLTADLVAIVGAAAAVLAKMLGWW